MRIMLETRDHKILLDMDVIDILFVQQYYCMKNVNIRLKHGTEFIATVFLKDEKSQRAISEIVKISSREE